MTEPRLIQYLEIILIIIPCRSACIRNLSTSEGFCWSIQMDWKYTIFDRYKVDVGDMWWEKLKVNENHLALATSPVYEIVMLDLLQTLFSSTSLLHHALLPCLTFLDHFPSDLLQHHHASPSSPPPHRSCPPAPHQEQQFLRFSVTLTHSVMAKQAPQHRVWQLSENIP